MSNRRFYSPTTGGFYSELIHGALKIREDQPAPGSRRRRMIPNPDCMIPADAVPVTPSEYEKLFTAQSEGKVIVARGGRPRAVDADEDAETRIARSRLRRDRLLAASDWTQLPDSPLASDQRAAWAAYRKALRDMDLEDPVWPVAPGTAEAETN